MQLNEFVPDKPLVASQGTRLIVLLTHVSTTLGGPARQLQQFRQKGEPSELRQFFQIKIKKSDFYPKMTTLVKL